LPYNPSSGLIWVLASGGAGFSTTHGPLFHYLGSHASTGYEKFVFSMKDKGALPLVLDYSKPGPLSGNSNQQFKVTLEGT